jgi:hypothetical protein
VRIGITGHTNLAPDAVEPVTGALRNAVGGLSGARPVTGVTCLARGADQLFARVVLDLGGDIEVVLPAADYRERKVRPDNASEFAELISKAEEVTTMPFETSGRDAYLAASEHVLASVAAMLAVWDGRPGDGRGGTGDVVAEARQRGIPVTVVWPDGAYRV